MRVYGRGSEILIDRKQEVMNMLALKAGMGPTVIARFINGIVYTYVAGNVFSIHGTFLCWVLFVQFGNIV